MEKDQNLSTLKKLNINSQGSIGLSANGPAGNDGGQSSVG
jgi:hypothetical protein